METYAELHSKLTDADRQTIAKLKDTEARTWLVNRLGNEGEKLGCRHAVWPMWAARLLDELREEK